jgi:serine/threonine-protein kinase
MLEALSPDGTRIVHVTFRGGTTGLVVREIDRLASTLIGGTEGALDPFFSPDGQHVAFIVGGQLKRVPIDGGPAVTIWRGDPTFEGGVWLSGGTIVFAQNFSLWRISANGGTPQLIAKPDPSRNEVGYDRPGSVPGGAIIYTVAMSGGRRRVDVRSLSGGDPKTVVDGGFGAGYLPPGFLIYGQADRLMAIRFDAATRSASGTAVPLEEGVFTNPAESVSNVSIAADGTAAFMTGPNTGTFGTPVWLDRTGARTASVIDQPLEHPRNVRLSPDGTHVAFAVGPGGQADIWSYDVTRAAPGVRLTFHDHNTFPIWSPDGREIAFMTLIGSARTVYAIQSDGSNIEPRALTAPGDGAAPMDWFAHGLLLYHDTVLWELRPPDKTRTPWMSAPFSQYGARLSPDGHWVAYASTQTGGPEVWIRPYPGPGVPVRVSSGGGHEPTWSHDGREIFYTNGTKMMAQRWRSGRRPPSARRSRCSTAAS